VFWRYLIGVLETFIIVLEIFYGFRGDILFVSWRYLMCVMEIFDGCPGDI